MPTTGIRYSGDVSIASTLIRTGAGAPLDQRDVVIDKSDLINSNVWEVNNSDTRYRGMTVFVEADGNNAENKLYTLIDASNADSPDYSGWQEVGGSYTLPLAADGTRGGIQIGYQQNDKNYPVQLSSEKAYVNVPWIDSVFSTSGDGLVPAPTSEDSTKFLMGDGTWQTITEGLPSVKIDGMTSDSGGTINRLYACSTSAGTAAKVASLAATSSNPPVVYTAGTFALEHGAHVQVQFSYPNTANNPTLSIINTTAKPIFVNGTQITTGTNKDRLKGVVDFVYDAISEVSGAAGVWHIVNSGTVTSVQVQGSGVISSLVSTQQSSSLNTTISINKAADNKVLVSHGTASGDAAPSFENISGAHFGSQTANTILAAPNGSNGTPTFRSLAGADIPLASNGVRGAIKLGYSQNDKNYPVVLGSNTGDTGADERAYVNVPWIDSVFGASTNGLVPYTGTVTNDRFLCDDGSWKQVSSGGGTDTQYCTSLNGVDLGTSGGIGLGTWYAPTAGQPSTGDAVGQLLLSQGNASGNTANPPVWTTFTLPSSGTTKYLSYIGGTGWSLVNSSANDSTVTIRGGNSTTYSAWSDSFTTDQASASTVYIPVMGNASASGGGAMGLVPTSAAGDHVKFLRGDGQWALPSVMIGATSSADGVAGTVPAPSHTTNDQTKFLRGDGQWALPSVMVGAAAGVNGSAGLVPAPVSGDQVKFLKGNGTWEVPYATLGSGSGQHTAGTSYVVNGSGGNTSYFLRGDGTWQPVSGGGGDDIYVKQTYLSGEEGGGPVMIGTVTTEQSSEPGDSLLTSTVWINQNSISLYDTLSTGAAPEYVESDHPSDVATQTVSLQGDVTTPIKLASRPTINDQWSPVYNKIITSSGVINNPTTANTFLKWNGSAFEWNAGGTYTLPVATSSALGGFRTGYNDNINLGNFQVKLGGNTGESTTDRAYVTIPTFGGSTKGLVPASGDSTKFLRGDGTWQTVSGSGGFRHMGMYTFIDTTNSRTAVDTMMHLFNIILNDGASNDIHAFCDASIQNDPVDHSYDGQIPVGILILLFASYLIRNNCTDGRLIYECVGYSDYFNYLVARNDIGTWDHPASDPADLQSYLNTQYILEQNHITTVFGNWGKPGQLPLDRNDYTQERAVDSAGNILGASNDFDIWHKYTFTFSNVYMNEVTYEESGWTNIIEGIAAGGSSLDDALSAYKEFDFKGVDLFDKDMFISIEHRSSTGEHYDHWTPSSQS